jgi:ABC-type microcin C transport system permease subunit YejB
MFNYILRRLLLIIPTLLGIMLINFIIVQAAPGGPVEKMMADWVPHLQNQCQLPAVVTQPIVVHKD